jgi:hypothetical protein
MNVPDPRIPAPADLAPPAAWEPKRLVTAGELARLKRRRLPAVPVPRMARRAGRRQP